MTDEELHEYLLNRPEAWLDYPFGDDVRVYKVRKKMFATLGWENGLARTNLKCDPDHARALRQLFTGVLQGYHMNKRHWNTVLLDGSVPGSEIELMVDHSYALVVKTLPRKERTHIEVTHGSDNIYRALKPSIAPAHR